MSRSIIDRYKLKLMDDSIKRVKISKKIDMLKMCNSKLVLIISTAILLAICLALNITYAENIDGDKLFLNTDDEEIKLGSEILINGDNKIKSESTRASEPEELDWRQMFEVGSNLNLKRLNKRHSPAFGHSLLGKLFIVVIIMLNESEYLRLEIESFSQQIGAPD